MIVVFIIPSPPRLSGLHITFHVTKLYFLLLSAEFQTTPVVIKSIMGTSRKPVKTHYVQASKPTTTQRVGRILPS